MASIKRKTPRTTNTYNITAMTIKISALSYLTQKQSAKFNEQGEEFDQNRKKI
jgi:hypothetical protein